MFTDETEKTVQAKLRRTRACFLISFAIHLLLVLGWAVSESIVAPEHKEVLPVGAEEPEIAFQLIEVPDRVPVEKPDALTDLLSDRDARAADMNPDLTLDEPEPFSEGDVDIRQYDRPEMDPARADREEAREQEKEDRLAEGVLPEIDFDYLDEMKSDRNHEYSTKADSPRNLLSSAANQGGISFNTYDWDFAPYMLAMKRAVERHLYPPYAFTHMGAVSGDNLIHFVVSPDGSITNLEILNSDAHYSLDRTSVRAIEAAAPFLPLPSNFPENFLEVTAHFSYTVRR